MRRRYATPLKRTVSPSITSIGLDRVGVGRKNLDAGLFSSGPALPIQEGYGRGEADHYGSDCPERDQQARQTGKLDRRRNGVTGDMAIKVYARTSISAMSSS